MNENNQPQSQQQPSESHPTFESIMNEWGDDVGCGEPVEWVLRHYDLKRREQPLSYSGDRLSESSHSPTEQPGDAKHTPGSWKHSKASVYIEREFDHNLWVAECRTYEDAELIAKAPALLSEVSTLRSKQAELLAENGIYLRRMAEQEATIRELCVGRDAQSAELEQLRSERDKLRKENERLNEIILNWEAVHESLAVDYRIKREALEDLSKFIWDATPPLNRTQIGIMVDDILKPTEAKISPFRG